MTAMDPYTLNESAIREPPKTIRESLEYLGPGFILSASIVGSGELIATTIVGARAGFVLMWFIIFSCLVKVTVQLEFGKHAISSGESTMASLNKLPGPRLFGTNWSIWTWLVLMLGKLLQVGGIVGGVVLALGQGQQLRAKLTCCLQLSSPEVKGTQSAKHPKELRGIPELLTELPRLLGHPLLALAEPAGRPDFSVAVVAA